jgi:3-dehydroquinate dehydratase I
MTVRIGPLVLGDLPRIAAPLADRDLAGDLGSVRRYADLVELRIDRCARHDAEAVAALCAAARPLGHPLLATVRAADEGGAAPLADAQRAALFEAALPLVDAVDVELDAAIRDPIVALARRHGRTVILSHHDFTSTPTAADLAALVDAGRRHGADIVKIATHASDGADTARLLDLLRTRRDVPLIVIAMGAHGVASRVFFPLLGSLLTYGFVSESGAPGQLSLAELHDELRRYSPEFAAAHPQIAR